MRQTVATVLTAALLVTAGCSTALTGSSGGTGTVNFYVSDQPGAIEDFEHLNVTVDEVTFVRADGNQTTYDANATVDLTRLKGANASLVERYEVEEGDYTKVFMSVDGIDATLTSGESANVKLPSEKLQLNQNFTVGNGEDVDFVYDIMVTKAGGSGKYVFRPVASESGTDVEIEEVDMAAGAAADAGDDENVPEETGTQGSMAFYVSDERNAIDDFEHLNVTITEVGFQRGGESGNWTYHDVDDRSVDLTELKGDNATLLQTFDVAEGNYTQVSVQVSEVDGTLTDGSSAEVKLPSSKLRINKGFEVEANSTVEFVYDITVVERGNSGAYNIKPVASESGTDVPMKKVGGDDEDEREVEAPDDDALDIQVTFVGNVTAGENATVSVTAEGEPVEGATVTFDGTEYTTDADGEATIPVPSDASDVSVEVTYEDAEAELETEFEDDQSGQENGDDSAATLAPLGA